VLIPRPRSILLIVFLLAGSLSPPDAMGQSGAVPRGSEESGGGISLEPHYPNPVSPETWIPFVLQPSLFQGGLPVKVTIRIYNSLSQVRAIPVAIDHPSGGMQRVINLEYAEPGRKIAYWDGKDLAGRLVLSGVYYLQLVVPGQPPVTDKLIVDNPRRRRSVLPF
jgi:hypothetical protein